MHKPKSCTLAESVTWISICISASSGHVVSVHVGPHCPYIPMSCMLTSKGWLLNDCPVFSITSDRWQHVGIVYGHNEHSFTNTISNSSQDNIINSLCSTRPPYLRVISGERSGLSDAGIIFFMFYTNISSLMCSYLRLNLNFQIPL